MKNAALQHQYYLITFAVISEIQAMKKIIYLATLLFITCTFSSCEILGDGCQVCQTVSYDNGNPIAWGTEAEYCDQDLVAIKSLPPTTSGGVTTYWECR